MLRLGETLKRAQFQKIKAQVPSIWTKGCILDNCLCIIWIDMTTPPWWRKLVMVNCYYLLLLSAEKIKIKVLEMVYLRVWLESHEWIELGIRRCRRAGIEREWASRADQRILGFFGHMKLMDDYRMASRVLMEDASGGRAGRGLGWMDGLKMALGSRGMTVEAGQQTDNAQKIGRSGEPWCIWRWLSLMPCVLSDHPPTLRWIITWRGVGCFTCG